MKKLLFIFLLFSLWANAQMPLAGVVGQQSSSGIEETLIRSIDAEFDKYQRHNVAFAINNTSNGTGTFAWQMLDFTTKAVVDIQYGYEPTWTLPRGEYILYGTVQGLNPDAVARVFYHKRITVLPVKFTEGEADRVLSLDDGNNIFDASGWTAGEQIFLKKIDATVGRIRINNYNSAAAQAHLIIDPSSEMEVNAFSGSSGLYLVNCQNILIDAVDGPGDGDDYNLFLNGFGQNTSHGIVINTTTDVRCEGIEIYGVKIDVDQSGATAVRLLADEGATYNRSDDPLVKFRFGHFWIVNAGHEGIYANVSTETDGGFGGPRQFEDLQAWDWIVDNSIRDPIQLGNCIDCIIHDWTINGAASGEEPSHNSYIVDNPGNHNLKVFNIRAKGGMHGISMAFGTTGVNPMIWNVVMEVETLPSQSAWNFIQTDAGATTDAAIMNVTIVANTGDEIVYRFDASGGNTRDIDDFTLINCTTIKGTSANFWTKDGTNPETNWDITSGNLTYIPATAATALLDGTTHLPSSLLCPSIDGGVSRTTRRTAAEMLADFGSLEFGDFDIDGYIPTDGEYFSGAGSGITLKLNDL